MYCGLKSNKYTTNEITTLTSSFGKDLPVDYNTSVGGLLCPKITDFRIRENVA